MTQQLLLIIHIIIAVILITMILLHHTKGADMSSFTSAGGASGTFFGSSGSGGFLYKFIFILIFLFACSNILQTRFIVYKIRAEKTAYINANNTDALNDVPQTNIAPNVQQKNKKLNEKTK